MTTEAELDEALSRPTSADIEAMASLEGDLLLLGAAGKMGPSLGQLAVRASQQAGVPRKIYAAARFSAPGSRDDLARRGLEPVTCDLVDRRSVEALPDCPNVLFMAGQKFGTSGNQGLTWAINAYAPAVAAERYASSRFVIFSSGNVYPLTPVESGGPTEEHSVAPVGEYAQSALGRERIFDFFSRRNGTPVAILRLNYAIDLRYGVLRDIADKVWRSEPIDLSMGYANVIWQRDANSVALRAFAHASSPPWVLNLTGIETISVRKVAERLGELLGIEPEFRGREAETALLSNAARCQEQFAPETATLDEMLQWTAEWIRGGGRSLGKPTHFEEREGRF